MVPLSISLFLPLTCFVLPGVERIGCTPNFSLCHNDDDNNNNNNMASFFITLPVKSDWSVTITVGGQLIWV